MTYRGDWRKALATENTAGSFDDKIPTTTKPANDGVVDLRDTDLGESSGTFVPSLMQVMPYLADAENKGCAMRVWGWSRYDSGGTRYWIPIMIAEFTVTAGDIAAGFDADAFMSDTIVLNDGDADTLVVSTAGDVSAYAVVDLMGSELVEFDFDISASGLTTSVNNNCLYKFVN
jgi:hypothetical protein